MYELAPLLVGRLLVTSGLAKLLLLLMRSLFGSRKKCSSAGTSPRCVHQCLPWCELWRTSDFGIICMSARQPNSVRKWNEKSSAHGQVVTKLSRRNDLQFACQSAEWASCLRGGEHALGD
eukprot:1198167-Pyramimonas_sp.AAC.1